MLVFMCLFFISTDVVVGGIGVIVCIFMSLFCVSDAVRVWEKSFVCVYILSWHFEICPGLGYGSNYVYVYILIWHFSICPGMGAVMCIVIFSYLAFFNMSRFGVWEQFCVCLYFFTCQFTLFPVSGFV